MIDLAQKGYSSEEVLNALRYAGGSREVKYRYDLLNARDVKIGELSTISGSLSFNASAQIKQQGQFTITEREYRDIDYLSDRIRVMFQLKIKNDWLEWPLGIFLISSPARRADGRRIQRDVTAFDANVILNQSSFTDRYLITKGTSYVNAVKKIVGDAGINKINIQENGAVLAVDKEYEIGENRITAVNELLRGVNYTSCYVDGNGYITAIPYVSPSERPIDHVYRDDTASVLGESVQEELDLFDTPNYFVRTVVNPESDEIMRAEYVNRNPASPLSVNRRGRSIVDYEEISDMADQQILQDYVNRIAFERSQVYSHVNFSTAAMPHHGYSDNIFFRYTILDIESKYAETNWSLDLSEGGQMDHTVRRIVNI